jgi:hypothetical protein
MAELTYEDIPRIEKTLRIELEYPNHYEISEIDYLGKSIIASGDISRIDPSILGNKIKDEIIVLLNEMIENQTEKINKLNQLIKEKRKE